MQKKKGTKISKTKSNEAQRYNTQDKHKVRWTRPCASDVKSNWPGQNDESENIARTEKKVGGAAQSFGAMRAALADSSDTVVRVRIARRLYNWALGCWSSNQEMSSRLLALGVSDKVRRHVGARVCVRDRPQEAPFSSTRKDLGFDSARCNVYRRRLRCCLLANANGCCWLNDDSIVHFI